MVETYIPTAQEIARRVARYRDLQPTSTSEDLAWVGQDALDIIYARTILPMVLEDGKNPFGQTSPVKGAGGLTMYISIMPPGQGPCLHSHNNTFETFMVLEGEIEYYVGDPVAHTVRLGKYDAFSCPPRVHRGFRNVGPGNAVQLTVITGEAEGNRDDVQVPHSVADEIRQVHGDKVLDAFRAIARFEPPRQPA